MKFGRLTGWLEMEISADLGKAYGCGLRRYVRQKSNDPIYIYSTKVARREMFVVLSSAEIKANKISPKSCYMVINGGHGTAEIKKERQARLAKNPEIPLLIKSMRGLRQHYKAQEKLEKMERDAKSVEGLPEVDSDSSLNAPS